MRCSDGLANREELNVSDQAPRSGHDQSGGASRDRTDDLLLAKQALSQLSYGPLTPGNIFQESSWWVWEDLNLRPHPYQGCALTN